MNAQLPNRPPPPLDAEAMRAAASYAITSRRSVRAFLPTPVDRDTLRMLLAIAARAPSGNNTQPWHVHVLTGAALGRVRDALSTLFADGQPETRDYTYYPQTWRDPYLARRRAVGWHLYELAGVDKGDRAGSKRQHGLNFTFFGAPVALIFTIDRDLEQGSWLDYGMFLQSVMVAARGFGLNTCPQAAIAGYPQALRDALDIPAEQLIVCGMALGWADPADPTNALHAAREPVDSFAVFHDA